MQQSRIVLTNGSGLHARPAAQFVKKAAGFKSSVTVEANGKKADAKSILQLLSLGAKDGTEIVIAAEGSDEVECIFSLRELLRGGLSE
ncbi:MAG: Phosphotransferase system, phosphocarrier protein HPr [Anaerosporomusa subterranea]|jgi:phosphocarrier protein|nr:Phosphotransferase system, phosphocarrier protein HPr [Anaerosporomusa subterranea]